MSDAVKVALTNLFNEIVKFVTALFNKEVGTDIEDELKGAWENITK